jgi:hypothetical protein
MRFMIKLEDKSWKYLLLFSSENFFINPSTFQKAEDQDTQNKREIILSFVVYGCGSWYLTVKQELRDLCRSRGIASITQSKVLRRAGNVAGETDNAYRFLVGKSLGMGLPKKSWESNTEIDLSKEGHEDDM